MNNLRIIICFILFFSVNLAFAQDLDSLLEAELNKNKEKEFVEASFKSGRIILGQSIENKAKGELDFLISHHFGDFSQGSYQFFGLDYSEIRIGFDYGLTDRLTLGIGRSSFNKIIDGNFKLKILKQSAGHGKMPVSVSFYSNMALTTLRWAEPERDNRFDSRFFYAFELLIARKMSSSLTLQITPSMIHRNLVKTMDDQNDVFSVGFGGRMKFSKRASINLEYYHLLPGKTADDFFNSLSVGVDIETGGHIFQIFLTNSNGLIEQAFISGTTGDWLNGNIKLGFNITRAFAIIKNKGIDQENF